MDLTRRTALTGLLTVPLGGMLNGVEAAKATHLIGAARARIGVTRLYDPAYVGMAYPGGDVPNDRGVCIDVIIRAYRTAFKFDFQEHIHRDMAANFDAYPKTWGLTRTDRNIDHRRVPNLETWLERQAYEQAPTQWQPGDMITCRVGGRLPHIGILSNRRGHDGNWTAIHNIGRGTLEDSRIWAYDDKRRFRFLPASIAA